MAINLLLKEIESKKEFLEFRNFIRQKPQHYPEKNYYKWVDNKCIPRIETGEYKSLIVLSYKEVVGDAVYKIKNENSIELKHLRIDEDYKNGAIGNFLLSQIEKENPEKEIFLDVTVNNFSGVEFFIRKGFKIIGKEKLYSPTQDEFIMKKSPRLNI